MGTKGCIPVLLCVIAAGLSGCDTVPPLEPIAGTEAEADGSIPIGEVVQRVKCELYDATKDVGKDYWWFRYWGAKVDLDLIVNTQSGITPSVAFLDPLRPFKSPVLGTISRSFSLGLNAGLTSTSSRTESVSFSTTFLEVKDQLDPGVANSNRRKFNNCNLPEVSELNSNLGLKEWINSALGPVKGEDAALLNWGGSVSASGGGKKAGPRALRAPESVASSTCRWRPGTPPLSNPNCRPPIDSITHAVEFSIVKSGGVTPSWTFVHFKGQSGNGSMASAQRTDTHRLTITLGPSQEDRNLQSTNQSLRLLAPSISNALSQIPRQ